MSALCQAQAPKGHRAGHVVRATEVAVAGAGVDDALGVATGQHRTDAARQAADMMLRDDAGTSIVAAGIIRARG